MNMHNQVFSEKDNSAYFQLKTAILNGNILYGERFTELQLSNKLGVSRMFIREAIQQLMYEGFIERSEKTGMRIKIFSEQDVIDIYTYRECMDGMLTRLFTHKFTPSQLFYLESMLDTINKNAETGTPKSSAQMDHEFHRIIAQGAANPHMLSHYEILLEKNMFFNRIFRHPVENGNADEQLKLTREHYYALYHEHEKIVSHIRNHDPDRAETAARESIKEGLRKILLAFSARFSN